MELKQPNIIPITDRIYRLEDDYVYTYSHNGESFRLTVRKGFMYDGASVPRFAWTITGIIPDGLIRAAALLHDWIYEFEGKIPKGGHEYLDKNGVWLPVTGAWSRKEADKLFARVMREAGVSKFKRRLAYHAVRLLGWTLWKD